MFVRSGTALLRVDAADGRKRWTDDIDHLSPWTVHGDRVYAAGTAMYALDADDGEELWSERVAEGLLDRVQVATDGGVTGGEDHAVFVGQSDEEFHRVAPDGDVTWSEAVPGDVRDFVVDGRVYAGSDGGIYALSVE